jgi:phosphoribosylformylglycinamidine cyclo-ligase
MDYEQAGVSVERGEGVVGRLKSMDSPAISSAIGGFASQVSVSLSDMRDPRIGTSTDGVGTKILVAKRLGMYDTIGVDLVAMCVNDLLVGGFRPVSFLDYIACGKIDEDRLSAVLRGIISGCEQAGCTLDGGETAEMPDLYDEDDLDLAGFAVGIAEGEKLLPRRERIAAGLAVYGVRSSGIHSNGLSLARKIAERYQGDGGSGAEELWKNLLTPTRIYCELLGPAIDQGLITAAAHVTGGGLVANLARVLPVGIVPGISWDWEAGRVFEELQDIGRVDTDEMRRVFNMGIGVVLVPEPGKDGLLADYFADRGEDLIEIGRLTNG